MIEVFLVVGEEGVGYGIVLCFFFNFIICLWLEEIFELICDCLDVVGVMEVGGCSMVLIGGVL